MYGKIVGGQLEYAPADIIINNTKYIPATEGALKSQGYKEIVYTDYPQDGNTYTEAWTETDVITQTWVLDHELIPQERREYCYETEKVIRWGNGLITVDEANKMWMEYMAEGNTEKTAELSALIAEAKADIRERYPDNE